MSFYFLKRTKNVAVCVLFLVGLLPDCRLNALPAPNWLSVDAEFLADVRILDDLPTPRQDSTWDFRAMRYNALFGASARTNSGLLSAEVLLNFGRTDTLSIRRDISERKTSQADAFLELLLANFFINSEKFTITVGRQFYGTPNTLRPFYGFYENYFYDVAASLDGISLDFKTGVFSGKLLLAREAEANREYANEDRIYAASAQLELFKIWHLGGEYNYLIREEDFQKDRLSFISLFSDIIFFDRTRLSLEYLLDYGEIKYRLGDDTDNFKGKSLLVSLNSERETRLGLMESRFIFLSGSADDSGHYERANNNHSYVYMGDIFGGLSFVNRFVYRGGFNIDDRLFEGPPPARNTQMFRLGATFKPKLPGNIRISADFYNFAGGGMLNWFQTSEELGSELDLGLTFSPYYKLDIKFGYAVFMPGKGLKEALTDLYALENDTMPRINNVTQLSLGVNWKF